MKIIFIIIIFFSLTTASFPQNTIWILKKDKAEQPPQDFPLILGFEYGIPSPFKNSFFVNTYIASIGFYLNERKTLNIYIEGGKLIPTQELNKSSFGYGSLGFAGRIFKRDKSRMLWNIGAGGFNDGKTGVSEGEYKYSLSIGLKYVCKITHILDITASVKYPYIFAGNGSNGINYYPIFSLGVLFFSE